MRRAFPFLPRITKRALSRCTLPLSPPTPTHFKFFFSRWIVPQDPALNELVPASVADICEQQHLEGAREITPLFDMDWFGIDVKDPLLVSSSEGPLSASLFKELSPRGGISQRVFVTFLPLAVNFLFSPDSSRAHTHSLQYQTLRKQFATTLSFSLAHNQLFAQLNISTANVLPGGSPGHLETEFDLGILTFSQCRGLLMRAKLEVVPEGSPLTMKPDVHTSPGGRFLFLGLLLDHIAHEHFLHTHPLLCTHTPHAQDRIALQTYAHSQTHTSSQAHIHTPQRTDAKFKRAQQESHTPNTQESRTKAHSSRTARTDPFAVPRVNTRANASRNIP